MLVSSKQEPPEAEPTTRSSASLTGLSSGVLPAPHLNVGVFSKRKGVRYHRDGQVRSCRFCEILRARAEPFLYEDEDVVVFRPLRPIVPSHVLIVPRAHIRNVNRLGARHRGLLEQMYRVAEAVMTQELESQEPQEPQDNDDKAVRYSFHVPPFNSIDHVHMHAFHDDPRSLGYYGRLKYRTESWWCRSYDQVMARLQELETEQRESAEVDESSSSSSGLLSDERQTA
ncbi:hypothetical protein PRIC1_007428 [Phytophthora ramorum]|uniref:HIT domain-containing protein n=1 Tax=Phytophthora ramorum TaxID=164328 RepID=H3GM60_PHYRM|nr:Histidine triad nucleotide-binding protein 3 [Phytophthora ramorum]KAH7502271.1 Histidine triad nucleotide-binding protein 3 [Phytophthora ramorum]